MMRQQLQPLFLFLALTVLPGCSADPRLERVGTQQSATTATGSFGTITGTPLPANLGSSQPIGWQGSRVDLAVADAWAACSVPANGVGGVWPQWTTTALDEYLAQIYAWMGQAQCTDKAKPSPLYPLQSFEVLRYWFIERSVETVTDPTLGTWHNDCLTDGTINVATGQPNPALATLQPTPVATDLVNDPNYSNYSPAPVAGAILNRASVNVCIAKHLRETSPGSAGGEALLYTADEQRQLIEVMVERTRIAVLQYTGLAILFSTPRTSGVTSDVDLLQLWAADTRNADAITQMAEDYAYAVDLHVQATREMAGLLGRSASARLPRGGKPTGTQDEMWGYESWRQRALALLYGGNPLAQNLDMSAPWQSTLSTVDPFPGYPGVGARDFPSSAAQPYVATDVTDPLVNQLERLARQYDALQVKQNATFVAAGQGVATPDPDGSARWIYMAVEAGLRTSNCDTLVSGACKSYQVTDIPVPDGSDLAHTYTSYDLWTRGRITPDHAKLLARRLSDYIGSYYRDPGVTLDANPGAMNMDGAGTVISHADETGAVTSWYHVPHDATFHDRRLQQYAGLYTRLGSYRMPDHIDPAGGDVNQGLLQSAGEGEAARRMGSVSTLSAARYGLWVAYNNAPNSATSGLLRRRLNILSLIDGAIGASGFSVAAASETNSTSHIVDQPTDASGNLAWRATITTAANDAFWDPTNPSAYKLMAVKNAGQFAANVVLYPNAKSFGQGLTIGGLVAQGVTATAVRGPSAPADALGTYFWEYTMSLPDAALGWTFFAVRQPSGGPTQYALLADNVALSTQRIASSSTALPVDGHWVGFNGRLTQDEHQAMARDAFNPAQPAYDGFGVPSRWSPSTNPALFASSQGQSPVQYYIGQAQSAATAATTQVKDAIQTLLQAQQDQTALAASVRKSVQVSQLEQQGLCGTTNPNCDTSIVNLNLDIQGMWNAWAALQLPPQPTLIATALGCVYPTSGLTLDAATVGSRLACLTLNMLSILPGQFRVAKVVADHQLDAQVPAFAEYEGGTLQKSLFAQWTAIAAIKDSIRQVLAAQAAAKTAIDAFRTKVEIDTTNWDAVKQGRCSPAQLVKMVSESSCSTSVNDSNLGGDLLAVVAPAAGIINCLTSLFSSCGDPVSHQCSLNLKAKEGVPDSQLTWDDAISSGTSYQEGTGFSVGFFGLGAGYNSGAGYSTSGPVPVVQRRQFCNSVQQTLAADEAQIVSTMFEAFATLSDRATSLVGNASQLLQASAEGAAAAEQVKLAKATADLEAQQLASTQVSTLGVYRQVRSFEVWRAQALLDAARVSAVAARRAIESHYAVSLSTMGGSEAFVASPRSWADEVYQYALSMPAAVGLDLTNGLPDGVNPNAVSDYVDNLGRFVNGFTVSRPTAVASSDLDVLTLPGPTGLVTNGASVAGAQGAAAAWSYACPSGADTAWLPLPADGNPNDACGAAASHPSAAQIAFSLDPWGRVNGDIASSPYTDRYNARWGRLAVNVVGTGVLDCTQAADPNACYTQQFVRYELTHRGPAWVTDWDQSWTVIGVPIGQIEGAKAIVAEQWIDPLQNNFSKPYVSAVARQEFADRPFGGEYNLKIDLGPEVRLDRIGRVQILVDSNYWVKQQ